MRFAFPRWQKPPIGTPIDRTNTLVDGLLWFAPMWENSGSSLADVVGGVNLSTGGSPIWTPGGSPATGAGVAFTSTSQYAEATLPFNLKIQAPATMVVGCRFLSAPGVGTALIFGSYLNNTGSSNFNAFGINYANSLSSIEMFGSTSSGTASSGAALSPTFGIDYTIVAVFGLTTYTFYAYPASGKSITTLGPTAWSSSLSATYTSTALLGLGSVTGYSRNPNCNIYYAGLWGRALSSSEAAACAKNIWQIFTPSIQSQISHLTSAATSSPSSAVSFDGGYNNEFAGGINS